MSFKEIQCHVIICDGCGCGNDNGDFTPHYPAGSTADMTGLQDAGWHIGENGGKDYCEDCRATVEHDHIFEGFKCAICHADEPLDTSGICRPVGGKS